MQNTHAAIACLNLIKQLKDSGVNIVATNNSWGGSDASQALQDAIEATMQDGVLFIAAAGNDFLITMSFQYIRRIFISRM